MGTIDARAFYATFPNDGVRKPRLDDLRVVSRAALAHFGLDRQITKATEECAELIVELLHWKDGKVNAAKVIQEIADVENVCDQLREIFTDKLVDESKEFKIHRLRKILGM